MEPSRETAEALAALAEHGDSTVAPVLVKMGKIALGVVPDCVGLSLYFTENELTLTLVATSQRLAALDAMQYLDGGPTLEAIEGDKIVIADHRDVMDENRWLLFAQASAATGVASTLSLPIHRNSEVIGAVTLYAASAKAFDGRHRELAAALGAYAPGAVINADLSFSSRLDVVRAQAGLEHADDIETAEVIISTRAGVSRSSARERLLEAAARAGITQAQAARAVIVRSEEA